MGTDKEHLCFKRQIFSFLIFTLCFEYKRRDVTDEIKTVTAKILNGKSDLSLFIGTTSTHSCLIVPNDSSI